MVSDPGNNKPRDVFHKRVLKSYHKRQQIQQRMTSTNSSDEDNGAVATYRDGNFVPKKHFCLRENESIDKNSSNSTTTTTIESSSMDSSSTVVQISPENIELNYGCISMIGRRRVVEDAIKASVKVANNEFVFFGAYDGHGGSRVSHACRNRLHYIFEEELLQAKRIDNNNNNDNDNNDNDNDNSRSSDGGGSSVNWKKVMMTCFSKMDDEVMRDVNIGVRGYEEGGFEDVEKMVGSAAVVVIVGKEEIVVANCGDCRAILYSHGIAIPLSNDHKADRPDEKKRVEAAGGKIINLNGSRVQGVLATSRSIGDHSLKPFVIPEPEVTVYKRNELDEFIVIATNGLWDVVSNEMACDIVRTCLNRQPRRRFPERDSAADAAALLAELAIAKGSKDNISVIVVELDKMSQFSPN